MCRHTHRQRHKHYLLNSSMAIHGCRQYQTTLIKLLWIGHRCMHVHVYFTMQLRGDTSQHYCQSCQLLTANMCMSTYIPYPSHNRSCSVATGVLCLEWFSEVSIPFCCSNWASTKEVTFCYQRCSFSM